MELTDLRRLLPGLLLCFVIGFGGPSASAQEKEERTRFLEFIKKSAARLRSGDRPPENLEEWESLRARLRKELESRWGPFPKTPCPLDARIVGRLKGPGYRVEKILFQTRPGVWMTANAYVPDGTGKHPAVLCVHGHMREAKLAAKVQTRSIVLAKRGYFVLAVDAFGAGERGTRKTVGDYHGEMVAATLWPTGLALSGLQVYENMRAVDYLRSRPEVDPDRIGITGSSGGGNQTMYAGAYDTRFGAAVPTCSVGNYQAYLGAACCMCEVVPGALTQMEEWGVLALTAPRGLMVTSATRDAFQFSVGEAKKSIAGTLPVFELYERPNHLRHTIIEAPHAYNQPMREAMYGWMDFHLKKEGSGEPIPEPAVETAASESLRCFPGDSRPDDFLTVPGFAAREARKILARRTRPETLDAWTRQAKAMRKALRDGVLGGFPKPAPLAVKLRTAGKNERILSFDSEPGLRLSAAGPEKVKRPVVLLDFDGREKAARGDLAGALTQAGWDVITLDLRATGPQAPARDKIGRAPDHNTAQWSLWIGRPLLGQWAYDLRRLIDALEETGRKPAGGITLIGRGPAGVVALTAAALDSRVTRVVAVDMLASYVSEQAYVGQRMGIMVPAILPKVGDIPHLAALAAPRRLAIAGGVSGDGTSLGADKLRAAYADAEQVYALHEAPARFTVGTGTSPKEIARLLGE